MNKIKVIRIYQKSIRDKNIFLKNNFLIYTTFLNYLDRFLIEDSYIDKKDFFVNILSMPKWWNW